MRSRVTPRGRRGLQEASRRRPRAAATSPRGSGHLLCDPACAEPPPGSRAWGCVDGTLRWRIYRAEDVEGEQSCGARAGAGACGAVLPSGLRLGAAGGPAPLGRPAQSSYLSAHFAAPASPLPPHPCPLASLCDAFARVRNSAERNRNCTQADTIAAAPGGARIGEAMRVAPRRLGAGKKGAFVCNSPPQGVS